ncbi:hypothetical protein GGQ80_000447 [Sphingomonas jinjuensis]|uniref:Uncharacterized protein n=1 Tax=Sphingomonas jinjuensis TaxID=535907 RepID=A0A840F7V0_9SPHN|nr:hypothetical protein [Sphingomonas jinjuensis]MBB4152571.1 hypothetical protein [Sphingomonas jinjuensis]
MDKLGGDATAVYDMLQAACKTLESWSDHSIAAVVSQAMAMVQDRYGVGIDHLDGGNQR